MQLLSEPYTNSSRNKVQMPSPLSRSRRTAELFTQLPLLLFQGNLPWVVEHAETSKGDPDQGQAEHGLRDRGLCLVPVSWTPEVYRDGGTAMDYWTPAYRGCLYR